MAFHDPDLLPADVPRLKKFTKYHCPTGGGLGHGSLWTGALGCGQHPTQHLCPCGAALVELVEDGYTYRVTWEALSPWNDGEWYPSHRDTTERASAVDQYRQLVEWERTGVEPVRAVRFLRAETTWVEVEP